jgi:hypothetical protein
LSHPNNWWHLLKRHRTPSFGSFAACHPIRPGFEEALNAAISGNALLKYLPPGAGDSSRLAETLRFALMRDLLNESLGEKIAPGNRLELFDGLHAVDAVEDAIDSGFDGLLDLSMCHSNVLAVFIDRRRQGRITSFHWCV